VVDCAEFLGGAWNRMTMTMAVISIGVVTKVIGRLWRCGVSKAETLGRA
jgi:hypothetical protein